MDDAAPEAGWCRRIDAASRNHPRLTFYELGRVSVHGQPCIAGRDGKQPVKPGFVQPSTDWARHAATCSACVSELVAPFDL